MTFEVVIVEIMKYLSISDRYTKMYLDESLAKFGLNSSQHIYIIKICENPGMTQDKFISCFYLHPSNITRSLTALEKMGFIYKKVNSDDKRTCRLYPTSKAKDIYQQIVEINTHWENHLLEGFDEKEQVIINDFLKRITENALKSR